MAETPLGNIERAIQTAYGVNALLMDAEHVEVLFDDGNTWRGEVLAFALIGHPSASICYAWEETDGKVTTVLHRPPVDGPCAAVKRSRRARRPGSRRAVIATSS